MYQHLSDMVQQGAFQARSCVRRYRAFAEVSRCAAILVCLLTGEGLFAGEDGADVGELVEGLERGEVVDVEVQELVADLGEHGVVELEDA